MRKGLIVLLAAVVVAMFAAPAMAGTDVSGFLRVKSYVGNFYNNGSAGQIRKDAPASAFVEERFRVRFAFGDENVKAVWFSEIDYSAWGDSSGSSPAAAERNRGGGLGADKINLETKNLYVWFKVPNTSVDFTVGMQGQSDAYAGLFYGAADMAGIFMNAKLEPVTLTLGWAKLYENSSFKTDDSTLYVASGRFAPTKAVNLGLNFYFLQDDTGKVNSATQLPFNGATTVIRGVTPGGDTTNKKRVYMPGFDMAFNAGPATLSGFFFYQFGKVDFIPPSTNSDADISGFAVDLRGDMNIGPGKAFLEGLYISGGDSPTAAPGNKYKSILTLSDVDASPGGNSAYGRTDMVILLGPSDAINAAQCLLGCSGAVGSQSPGNFGRGMWHIGAGYTQKFTDKVTGKIGAGYLAATKLFSTDASFIKKEMGTEVNAMVHYNIMKGLDVGLVGAYAWIGDFFKPNATDKVDGAYDLHARLNYAF